MSSNEKKSSGASTIFGIVIGAAMMAGGFYVSTRIINVDPKPALIETLEKTGIPVDPGITLASLGVLLILFPVIKFFFVGPLGDAISARNHDLEQTFTEAEQLRGQMQTMRSDYEQRLVATEAEARARIEAQIKEAQSLRQSLMAEATQRADELVQRASQEIEAEKERVLTGLRTHVVDLALAAAEKVIGENMDTERNRKMVDDFVSQVEVAH